MYGIAPVYQSTRPKSSLKKPVFTILLIQNKEGILQAAKSNIFHTSGPPQRRLPVLYPSTRGFIPKYSTGFFNLAEVDR